MSSVAIAVVILFVSLASVFAPRTFAHRLTKRQFEDLTGVASGLLLTSALLVVVPEGFHSAVEGAASGEAFAFDPIVLGATVLLGFVAMLMLEGFGIGHAVHEEHHDHVDGHGHGHVHHPGSVRALVIGLSVHAMADGLAIGAASAAGDAAFSFFVTLAVVIHRVAEGLSLGLFAAHESVNRSGVIRGLLMFSLATPAVQLSTSIALDGADQRLIALALLFSAGTFVYVATVDTLPAIHNPETGRRSVRNVVLSAAAFSALFLVFQSAGLLEHGH